MTNKRINQSCVCQQCGITFHPFRASKGLFCSNECKFQAKEITRQFICAHCQKQFTKKKTAPKFCSHKCYLLQKTTRGAIERLEPFILKTDYCWIWQGGTNKAGYGRLFFQGKFWLAHRLMWKAIHGRLRRKDIIRHFECDNPPCVNPDHLKNGTMQDNMDDCVNRSRHAHGETSYAKLTEQQVLAIRRDNRSHQVIADEYGVGRRTIGHIIRRDTWKHLE